MSGWNQKQRSVTVEFSRPQLRRIIGMAREKAAATANRVDRRVLDATARTALEALQRARAADRERLGGVG